jgi:hypothetical protein
MNLYGFANGDPITFSDPFGLCPKGVGGDGRTSSVDDCSQGTKNAWFRNHVHVNPHTDWRHVDRTLRDAVVRGSMLMQADYYISAGKETGHAANSLHPVGRAVDISRVDGSLMSGMDDAQKAIVGLQVLGAVVSGIPFERRSEMYSPALALRADRTMSYDLLEEIRAAHVKPAHVHIGIGP